MAQLNNPTLAALLTELEQMQEAVWFLNHTCDEPGDLLYHAKDETWWKREGLKWTRAEPPKGWVKEPESESPDTERTCAPLPGQDN